MTDMNTYPRTPSDVAKYFENNEATDYQARMLRECGQNVKSYPFDRTITNPNLRACHHRFCPACQQRRGRDWAAGLRAVIDGHRDPKNKKERQLTPHWIEITLPGIESKTSELRQLLEIMKNCLSDACSESFWRYKVLAGVSIMRFQMTSADGTEMKVIPTYTLIANVSSPQFRDLERLERQADRAWIQPINRNNWPGVTARPLATATHAERDRLQARVSRMIEGAYVFPEKQAFLQIARQLKGVNSVVMCRSQRSPLLPAKYSQTGDLRYEQEYTVSRVGEDLQVSLSGNRDLAFLPWD